MRLARATPFAQGIDTVEPLTEESVAGLVASGIVFAVRYLGSLTPSEVEIILSGGLALMPVTYADRFDGIAAARELRALQLPIGVTTWLDLEGTGSLEAPQIITRVNDWVSGLAGAGEPGLYVGSDTKLSSGELYALRVVRYWHAASRVLDRSGALAEPSRGWCLRQLRPPNTIAAGIRVDRNVIEQDYFGGLPAWIVCDAP